ACNQDDHSKNWAFLQNDNGQWQPAPFYDVTFSPHPFNEHATAFLGYGKKPPLRVIQQLAGHAGFADWKQAQQHIQHIVEAISNFAVIAKSYGVQKSTLTAIEKALASCRKNNSALL
ncbi:MAG TPA: HipA domain-containing protein, partial [Pseudomonas sp.]|nr:HipA domain-containing protein [Pseudomonas sp.]